MNRITLAYCVLVLFLALVADMYAVSPSEPKPFEAMDVAEAELALNSEEGYTLRREYARRALQSGRMDLIALCFGNQYTAGEIRKGAAAMPDTVYRDRLVVLMLRGNMWPDERYAWYWSKSSTGLTREPFIAVLRKYFPTMATSENLLDSRVKRLSIANDLEKAINRAATSEHRESNPNNRIAASNIPPYMGIAEEKHEVMSGSAKTKDAPTRRIANQHNALWVIATGVIGMLIFFAFKCRRRRKLSSSNDVFR